MNENEVQRLERLLRRAHVNAHLGIGHEAAAAAYKERPELQKGGEAFYHAMAVWLLKEGVRCESPSKAG